MSCSNKQQSYLSRIVKKKAKRTILLWVLVFCIVNSTLVFSKVVFSFIHMHTGKDFMTVVLITLYSVTVIRNQHSHLKTQPFQCAK